MGKYSDLVNNILSNIGGKSNVTSVTHCVTRLRFYLNDESKANDDAIKNLDGVVTVVRSNGQYQVVIGNHVPDVYREVMSQTAIGTAKNQEVSKKTLKEQVFYIISGMLGPSIAILSASGIIQGFNALLSVSGMYTVDSSVYILINAIGKAMIYFFPIFVALNVSRRIGMNEYLGMAIGAILCMPAISGVDLTFFGHTVNVTYTETVLPALIIVLCAAPVEKFFNKIIPDVVKSFLTPVFVLITVVPIGFTIIGPFANYLGYILSGFIQKLISFSPLLAGIVSAGAWQIFVMFGVHMMIIIPSIMNLMQGIPDQFLAFIGVVSFAQTAVVLAIWLKTKNQKLKNIALPAWISGIFGVTEAAIYGVTLPRMKYFIISCIAAAFGGGIVGILDVHRYRMAGLGIFSLPGHIPENGTLLDVKSMLIAIAISSIIAFALTYILYHVDGEDEVSSINNSKKNVNTLQNYEIMSPLSGELVSLDLISDAAFASGALGQGLAIIPTEGKVIAPFDGIVTVLFPTKHAVCIISDAGLEILIHVGMDTVQLEGEFFSAHVKQGQRVKKGELLLTANLEGIKSKGLSIETPIIVTNSSDYTDVISVNEKHVNTLDKLLVIIQ